MRHDRERAERDLRSGAEAGGSGEYGPGYEGWSEPESTDEYGPARYGYGPYHDRLRRRRRSDSEIRQEVEDALFYDTWVDADAIGVSVDDGVVTLSGVLPSYEELRYAVDDAWAVDGVRGVRSELEVDEHGACARPGSEGGAHHIPGGPPAGASARDPHAREDARLADPQWRSHLNDHPDGGGQGGSAGGSAGASDAPARPRGRRRRAATSAPDESVGVAETAKRSSRRRTRASPSGGQTGRGRRPGGRGEATTGGASPPSGAKEAGEDTSASSMEGGTNRPV